MYTRLLAFWHLLLAPFLAPPPAIKLAPSAVAAWTKTQVAKEIAPLLRENIMDSTPQWASGGRGFAAQLTLRPDLQRRMSAVIAASRADYVAMAAVDAHTGAMKVLLGRSPPGMTVTMPLRASFPAASVFKLVTAAAAIDLRKARPETALKFRGGNHELYHFSLSDHSGSRHERSMRLRDAFALSVNPVFARLGAEVLGKEKLIEYATRFGFGQALPADFPIEEGQIGLTDNEWALAETASGYNWRTQMSAVQAAVFAAGIANDGMAMEPYLAQTVITASGEVLYQGVPRPWHRLIEPGSARLVREIMRETVRSGTARSALAGNHNGIEIGGKTGTLANLLPNGRCDWFVGYAAERDANARARDLTGDKIGFAVLVIHTHPNQAKAAALARALVTAYFQRAIAGEKPLDITLRNVDFVEIDE